LNRDKLYNFNNRINPLSDYGVNKYCSRDSFVHNYRFKNDAAIKFQMKLNQINNNNTFNLTRQPEQKEITKQEKNNSNILTEPHIQVSEPYITKKIINHKKDFSYNVSIAKVINLNENTSINKNNKITTEEKFEQKLQEMNMNLFQTNSSGKIMKSNSPKKFIMNSTQLINRPFNKIAKDKMNASIGFSSTNPSRMFKPADPFVIFLKQLL